MCRILSKWEANKCLTNSNHYYANLVVLAEITAHTELNLLAIVNTHMLFEFLAVSKISHY